MQAHFEKTLFIDSNNLVLANIRFSQITVGSLFAVSIFVFFLSAIERQFAGMVTALLGLVVFYFWFINLQEKWKDLHGPLIHITTEAVYLPNHKSPIHWEKINKITLESITVGHLTRTQPRNFYKIHLTTKEGIVLTEQLHGIAFDRLSLQRIAKRIQPTATNWGARVDIASGYHVG